MTQNPTGHQNPTGAVQTGYQNPTGAVPIVLNGEPFVTANGTTVAAVVAGLTAATTGIAVALNGTVVPRGRWQHERVVEGDSVEIVTAVQGG